MALLSTAHWRALACFAFLVASAGFSRGSEVGLQTTDTDTDFSSSQKRFGHERNANREYRTVRIPEYPKHAVRIREQTGELCDARSRQYTGWLDTGGKHLFFWYFESLNDPRSDPLNLWMTGGPGCSGLVGMMFELGPCLITKNSTDPNTPLGTYRNPYSWTRNASMIFIDQPTGTGFSYADPGVDLPGDSFAAARDMVAFLLIFLSAAFPHLRQVPFHISGESAAGHYVPVLAAEIVRHNEMIAQENNQGFGDKERFPIPLTSLLIGDGFVSPRDTMAGFYDTLCSTRFTRLTTPVFNATRCTAMAAAMPRCQFLWDACYAFPDWIVCSAADAFCQGAIEAFYFNGTGKGGRDPFDVTHTCEVDLFCYKDVLRIQDLMNTPLAWKALGLGDKSLHLPKNFTYSILSEEVNSLFSRGMDGYSNVAVEVKYVLEHGVDVLVYNGNLDLTCNTAGNLRWTESVPWAGQAPFVAQDLRRWSAPTKDGRKRVAGTMKEVRVPLILDTGAAKVLDTLPDMVGIGAPGSGGKGRRRKQDTRFAFVTVDAAGHLVPFDQPEVAFYLVQTWMNGWEFAFQEPSG